MSDRGDDAPPATPDRYEVRIWMGDGDPAQKVYAVDHRFPRMPADGTVADLVSAAVATFAVVYPGAPEPECITCRCYHLSGEERQKSAALRDREWT